jgi:hypothetical protein
MKLLLNLNIKNYLYIKKQLRIFCVVNSFDNKINDL